MTLKDETFELTHGWLRKDLLRKKHHDESCRTILSKIETMQGDKVECYYSTLGDENRGDTYLDVLLLVKEDEEGFRPFVIKNTIRCAVGRCVEYMNYNEGGVVYSVVDYETWNVDELMKHVYDKYKGGLRDFLIKKYDIMHDEVVIF